MTTDVLSASNLLSNELPNWKDGRLEKNGERMESVEAKRERCFKGEEMIGQIRLLRVDQWI